MNDRINELLLRIRQLQDELEEELDVRREQFNYHLEQHKVRFEQRVVEAHKKLRTDVIRFVIHARLRDIFLAPVIYAILPPLLLLDLTLVIYQAIYFRAYGIPRVNRSDYIVIDRHQLAYLNGIEKVNCVYCGYANGLFGFAKEVGARTEQYWCPIKHSRRILDPHHHYPEFLDFGDGESYQKRRKELHKNRSR